MRRPRRIDIARKLTFLYIYAVASPTHVEIERRSRKIRRGVWFILISGEVPPAVSARMHIYYRRRETNIRREFTLEGVSECVCSRRPIPIISLGSIRIAFALDAQESLSIFDYPSFLSLSVEIPLRFVFLKYFGNLSKVPFFTNELTYIRCPGSFLFNPSRSVRTFD